MPIASIERSAAGDPGTVRPGTSLGAVATPIPRTTRRAAVAALASAPRGSSFSIPIKAAIKTIQPMLITPSANSAAIKAQQQPTQ